MKQVALGLSFAAAAQAVKLTSDENKIDSTIEGNPVIWWTEDIGYGAYGDYRAPQGIIDETAYAIEYFTLESVQDLGASIFNELVDHANEDAEANAEIIDAFTEAREDLIRKSDARDAAWAQLEEAAINTFVSLISDEIPASESDAMFVPEENAETEVEETEEAEQAE